MKGSATEVVASSFELNQRVSLLHIGVRTSPLVQQATKTAVTYLASSSLDVDYSTYLSQPHNESIRSNGRLVVKILHCLRSSQVMLEHVFMMIFLEESLA